VTTSELLEYNYNYKLATLIICC